MQISRSQIRSVVHLLFQQSTTAGVCSKDDFLCANDKCVKASMICDGKDDCGDESDEGTVCSGDYS